MNFEKDVKEHHNKLKEKIENLQKTKSLREHDAEFLPPAATSKSGRLPLSITEPPDGGNASKAVICLE